ncbi:hypothetical protein TNIN_20351 [Trichonephila inaurata madagascariensis]|uniref:Uncharacterized protein n=1 Tax=Trichonephila inaurata madagascariensis TaxID=2747483 RepID=A0A8X6KDP8_9ARAC|nr:hypothetical protein TNIN_20351 [Trichonephila inaurata madagascariensis]
MGKFGPPKATDGGFFTVPSTVPEARGKGKFLGKNPSDKGCPRHVWKKPTLPFPGHPGGHRIPSKPTPKTPPPPPQINFWEERGPGSKEKMFWGRVPG